MTEYSPAGGTSVMQRVLARLRALNPRSRLAILGTGLVAVGAGLLLVLLFVVLSPPAYLSATGAVLAQLRSRAGAGSPLVLASTDWGKGKLVLARYDEHGGRKLRLSFVARRGRGWGVVGYADRRAELTDVGVGSLIVVASRGGRGQPSWTAAAGELRDDRIRFVEIDWATGKPTRGDRIGDSYLIVRSGSARAVAAIYLNADGSEIATVPVPAT